MDLTGNLGLTHIGQCKVGPPQSRATLWPILVKELPARRGSVHRIRFSAAMITTPQIPLHRLILSLSDALDFVHPLVADHQQRVAYIAIHIARQMRWTQEQLSARSRKCSAASWMAGPSG